MSSVELREKRISKGASTLMSRTRGLPGTTILTTMHMEASTPTLGLG